MKKTVAILDLCWMEWSPNSSMRIVSLTTSKRRGYKEEVAVSREHAQSKTPLKGDE
jgi:hypothetical protein